MPYHERYQGHTQAIKELSLAIAKEPANFNHLLDRAYNYYLIEDYDKAILDCDKILKKNKIAKAYAIKALALCGKTEYDLAEEVQEKGKALDNNCALIYKCRGLIFKQRKQYGKSIYAFTKSIKADNGNDLSTLIDRGNTYNDSGEFDKAIKDYFTVTKKTTDDERVYYNLGLAYLREAKYTEAIEAYNNAISLREDYAAAYANRGCAKHYSGDYDGSIADCTTAISISDADPKLQNTKAYAHYNRAFSYWGQVEYDSAMKDFDDAINIGGDVAEFYRSRAGKNESLRKYKKAYNDYEYAKKLYEDQTNTTVSKALEKKIKKLSYYLRDPEPDIARLEALMSHENLRDIEENIASKTKIFTAFIRESSDDWGYKDPVFIALRRWNSYTPIIAKDSYSSKGGGYFIDLGSTGIVIDPGFNFIENFIRAGYKFSQITKVFISHAHNDHTADIESILTLLHKYNEYVRGEYYDVGETTIYAEIMEKYGDGLEKDVLDRLVEQEFQKSKRRKSIDLYLTKSTFKKYSDFFSLGSKADYTITIINESSHMKVAGMNIWTIPAKHNDLLSDRDALGFVFEFPQYFLVYTGDTGFDTNIENQYKALIKKTKKTKKKIVLLAHIGGFKYYEYNYRVPNCDEGKAYYKNHLGRLGLARLVELLNPSLCLISEFGEEFSGSRELLTGVFHAVYPKTNFLPVDIGLAINSQLDIEAINMEKTRGVRKYIKKYINHLNVLAIERASDASLHYYCKNIQNSLPELKEHLTTDFFTSIKK